MGDVYLAVDPTLDRQVAVKVLPESLADDTDRLSRFLREAKAASALNHPNILTVYDFGSDGDAHFLVTELVDGRTLREWVAEGRPSLGDIVDVVAQAASALEAAHHAGIVHRDVKPENLMLRRDGLVKVLDFGIAKLTAHAVPSDAGEWGNAASLSQTMPGMVLGTVLYMSPEQANGQPVDARSDVWSLGVVLYELVAGRSPFAAASKMSTLVAILEREVEPLDRAVPGTPASLARLVERALRKSRDERLGSAAELAAELRRLKTASGPVEAAISQAVEPLTTAETRAFEAPTGPTNLPPRTSELIGRARELGEITGLLRESETRLVTITGAGGSGKTRLAVEAGRELTGRFPDGVFAVELSALRSPAHVVSQIAETLDVNETPGVEIAESVARHLSDKRLLLVLDNFEHLLEASPIVGELVQAAPEVKMLVTSRALLRLSDEREFALEPLVVPDAADTRALDELARTPAVALFVERAKAARPSFALTAEIAGSVVEICRRLDGLPLAIELAAARVRFLAPTALLARLDQRLKLLTGGALDLPDRQQTMRAAIAWSYDLLEASEQSLVRRLAVFAGGCTLDAAEAIGEGGDAEVLDVVTSLVDKSLLRHREQDDGQVRFTMLEVVREFGLEQLDAAGEADETRLAHAWHYRRFAEEAAEGLRSDAPDVWHKSLVREYENLRSALGWLLERHPDDGARLAGTLYAFYFMRGLYTEGYTWTRRALEVPTIEPSVRARLLMSAGDLARFLNRLEDAVEHARACVEVTRAIDDKRTLALALNILGSACVNQPGETVQARAYYSEGLALAREIGYRRLEGLFLLNLGVVDLAEGNPAAGRASAEQALEIEGRTSRTDPAATFLLSLGEICVGMGDLEAARKYFCEGLSIAVEFGNRLYVAMGLNGMAAVATVSGDLPMAARLGGATEAHLESVGGRFDLTGERLRIDYVAKLGEGLDAAVLDREWSLGRALSMEAAVAEACGVRE